MRGSVSAIQAKRFAYCTVNYGLFHPQTQNLELIERLVAKKTRSSAQVINQALFTEIAAEFLYI